MRRCVISCCSVMCKTNSFMGSDFLPYILVVWSCKKKRLASPRMIAAVRRFMMVSSAAMPTARPCGHIHSREPVLCRAK